MSFLEFVKLHGPEFLALLFGLLFLVSEWLAMNPKIESNSVFQFIRGFIKKKAGKP